jgi:hypothetical protein
MPRKDCVLSPSQKVAADGGDQRRHLGWVLRDARPNTTDIELDGGHIDVPAVIQCAIFD